MADHENLAGRPLPGWRLKDCAGEHLRMRCPRCRRPGVLALRDLSRRLGEERRLWQVIPRLRCGRCGAEPESVELVYGLEGARALAGMRSVRLV